MDQPAHAPARHRPRFGEAVDDEDVVVGLGDRGKTRRRRVVDDRRVNFVRNDRDAALAREIQDRALLAFAHDPAGRIAGRGKEDRLRPRVRRIEQALEIERPRLAVRAAVQGARNAARRPSPMTAWKIFGHIGEMMRTLSPGSHTHCSAICTPIIAAPGTVTRSSVDLAPRLTRRPSRNRLAQLGHPARKRVKRLALVQRPLGGIANEVGGHDVALAEPQRDDVACARGPKTTPRRCRCVQGPDVRADGGHRARFGSFVALGPSCRPCVPRRKPLYPRPFHTRALGCPAAIWRAALRCWVARPGDRSAEAQPVKETKARWLYLTIPCVSCWKLACISGTRRIAGTRACRSTSTARATRSTSSI